MRAVLMVFSEDAQVKIPRILHLVRRGYRYLSWKKAIGDEVNQQLAQLRDGLLPLLMNGQITAA
jgi:hypothetical protein